MNVYYTVKQFDIFIGMNALLSQVVQVNIFDFKSIVILVSLLINTGVGFWLLFSKKKINEASQKDLSYALLFISMWLFSSWINHFHSNITVVTFFTRISFISALFSLASLVSFSFTIRGVKLSNKFYVGLILLALLTLFTNVVVESAIPASLGRSEGVVFGQYHLYWALVVVSLVLYSIFCLYDALRQSVGVVHERVKYLIISLILTIFIVLFFNVILPLFAVQSLMYIGLILSVLTISSMSWLVIQERVFSLEYVIALLIAHLILTIILFSLSWSTQKFEQLVLGWDISELFNIKVIIFGLFVASIVAFFIEKAGPFIRHKVFKIFRIPIITVDDFSSWLIKQTNQSVDLNAYGMDIVIRLKEIFRNVNVALYIQSIDALWSVKNGVDKKILHEYMSVAEPLYIENSRNGISLILPIRQEKENFGLLVMWKKKDETLYSREEISVLEELSGLVSIAANRYVYYIQQENFNKRLKKEVNKATKELKKKISELEEARRRERDMMDIIGHELRTPLSIMKIKQSLLRDRAKDQKKAFDRELFLRYDEEITKALDKEVTLLETLLRSSHLDSGTLSINMEKILLKEIVDLLLVSNREDARRKGLELTVEGLDDYIFVYADKVKLHEIVDNLVSNAIKYTEKGFVKIIVSLSEEEVFLTVKDSGIGIPEDAIPRLGEKFYRVNQYIGEDSLGLNNEIVRPGGTGLGLYITFSLAKLMEGYIQVESKLGVGSKFTLCLKRYKGQKIQKKEEQKKNVFDRLGLNKS